MATIQEENKKILRRALDVIVGMDVPFVEVQSVTATGNYIGSSGEVNGTVETPNLMDLSNGGFLNDGLAIPLGNDTDGFVAQINTPLILSVTLAEASDSGLAVIGYLDGALHKWEFSGSGASRTVTIPGNAKRIIINRVIGGEAFWFDNASLISCNLQLRAVETKVDNPELQMSEIDIEGYEPNDITDVIGYIGTGYPIYYTSGYPGDMAPARKFYLGEPIEFEDKTVKIKGYDATYFLDEEFGGDLIGNPSTDRGAGINVYFDKLADIVRKAGVDLDYINTNEGYRYEDGMPIFIPKKSKRAIIAQAVNLFRWDFWSSPYDPIYINYVDAGIPKMWTGKDTSKAKTIELTTRPRVLVDPVINEINMTIGEVWVSSSQTVDTISVQGTQIGETSDPYYSFTTSSGTVSKITPYSYRITASGSATISGRLIYFYDPTISGTGWTPLTVTGAGQGISVTLEDFYSGAMYQNAGGTLGSGWAFQLPALLNRSNISYEFDFRGDPNLQPRDYIKVDIDGSGTLVDMTIDNIELRHEGGGTSSTIVARKGFI